MPVSTSTGRSSELYVRSHSPPEPHTDEFARRVRALERASRVPTAPVTVWGAKVGLPTTAPRTAASRCILDRIAEFRAWAEEADADVLPLFASRTVASSATGETYTALRLPVCCLAETVDGEVVHVAPHRTDDETVNVSERLDAFEWSLAGDRREGPGLTRQVADL